jgi:Effector protein
LGSVKWNPNLGSADGEGNNHSPALILMHEMEHGADFANSSDQYNDDYNLKDATYDNNLEKKAIDATNTVSKELQKKDPNNTDGGNGGRKSHKEGKPFPTDSPTSNKPKQ